MTTVSQEAREAASRHYGFDDEKHLTCWDQPSSHHQVERLAKSFAKFERDVLARHRQSAERGEVVAWMYVRGENSALIPLSERASHMTEHGWTEHALGIIPTPPEAA